MNRTGKTRGDKLDPAAGVIVKLGGVRKLARELDLDPSAVTRWQTAVPRGGGGGLIPARYHWTLLALGRARGVSLAPDDLIGAPPS